MVPALPPPLGLLRGRCRLHENGGEGDDDYESSSSPPPPPSSSPRRRGGDDYDRVDASMGGGVENDKFPEYDDGEA